MPRMNTPDYMAEARECCPYRYGAVHRDGVRCTGCGPIAAKLEEIDRAAVKRTEDRNVEVACQQGEPRLRRYQWRALFSENDA